MGLGNGTRKQKGSRKNFNDYGVIFNFETGSILGTIGVYFLGIDI